VIGPSQRPLPDNKQRSQERDINAPSEIRNPNPSRRAAVETRVANCMSLNTMSSSWHSDYYTDNLF